MESNDVDAVLGTAQCGPLYAAATYDGCHLVNLVTADCSVAVGEIQDNIGQRISGWETFRDGLIIQFQDGTEMPLWSRRIDCLDPPYRPVSKTTRPAPQSDSGNIMPTGPESEPQGTPFEIPPSQAQEPWLAALKESIEADDCGDNLVRNRTASLDGNFEYFQVCAGGTSNLILQRRLRDGHLKQVTHGEMIGVVRNGRWAGFLLVRQQKVRPGGGAYQPVLVVRPDGQEMFEIAGSEVDEAAVDSWLQTNGWTAN